MTAMPAPPTSRTVRIFLSSTFRDFGKERDLLIRRVFPALRARLRSRFVELVDVDLRWGITAEQADRGEVLPICLAEIDRSRPFFVGLLGERYGWVPDKDSYPAALVEQRKWLKRYCGERSVTELEILHGVLNNPKMTGNALFYFRSAAYARSKGGDFLPTDPEDRARQRALKQCIRESGFPVVENYPNPEALAKRLEKDIWAILDRLYPATDVPDAYARENARHHAYAAHRRRLYLGGERYVSALVSALDKGARRILIEGASGGGKSTLLANALDGYRTGPNRPLMLEHYLGASTDAATAPALVRRLVTFIQRTTQSDEPIPGDHQALFESLPLWLAIASAWARENRTRWVFVLDALNGLSGDHDLRWLPEYLPPRLQLVVSCLDGAVKRALEVKGNWKRIRIKPLKAQDRGELLRQHLARFNKLLPAELERRILRHPLASNPLWLKTLAEELRLFGSHDALAQRLHELLSAPRDKASDEAPMLEDLFVHVLARVEGDHGRSLIRDALTALWASRAGLSEKELLDVLAPHAPQNQRAKPKRTKKGKAALSLAPAFWAPIRLALDDLLLESSGRLVFSHDYVRTAVCGRYLPTESRQRAAHRALAKYFEGKVVDLRVAEELPWQWQAAKAWGNLRECLTRVDMFYFVLEHRGAEELMGFWLAMEKGRFDKRLIEAAYNRAWYSWRLPKRAEITGEMAFALTSFLRYAGRGLTGTFADVLARLATAIAEKAHGPEHPETGMRRSELALLLENKGDYAAAEPLFRRSLEIAEKVQGPDHQETGTSLNNLALLLEDKGEYAAAEPLYRRALAIAEKVHGLEHPSTGTSLNNLAGLLQNQGDYVAAEPLFRRALAIMERAKGSEHPSTGTCLNNLAQLLQKRGDYAAAETFCRRALSIHENVLGPEHPETGTSLNNLALLLEHKGDYGAAKQLYRRALEIAENVQGSEHPSTSTYLNNLAGLFQKQGDYAAAEPLLWRALAIAEKVHGPEHPTTGTFLKNMAALLEDKDDYATAEPLYRRAVEIAEKVHGPEHSITGARLSKLAGLLLKQNKYFAAEPLCRRALEVAENVQGPLHPKTASRLHALALCLVDLNRCEEAIRLFQRELAIISANNGNGSERAAYTNLRLGVLLRDCRSYGSAEECLGAALQTYVYLKGRKSSDVATCINCIGQLEAMRGDFESAIKHFREALRIRQAVDPDNLSGIRKLEDRLAAARIRKSIPN